MVISRMEKNFVFKSFVMEDREHQAAREHQELQVLVVHQVPQVQHFHYLKLSIVDHLLLKKNPMIVDSLPLTQMVGWIMVMREP